MTFRRFTSTPSVLAALSLLTAVSLPALAQNRHANQDRHANRGRRAARPYCESVSLPAHGINYGSLFGGGRREPKRPGAHSSFWDTLANGAPRGSALDPRCVGTGAPDLNAPGTIALGAYFYQNGQCAPGDEGAVNAWRASTGRLPAVWMIFQSWTGWNQFPIAQARRARQLGGQLLVTWEPWSGNLLAQANWNCARIAAGAQDDYIRQYARAVKDSHVPVMIRFAHEMNGDWYPWSTAYQTNFQRHNGNSPANFVAMWRHVVALFRAEGASNVQWVWAPNVQYLNRFNSERDQSADLRALYPGDDAVDWIGLTVYNDTSKRSWRTFADLFDSTYRTITRISPRPMMIAELGVTEAGAPYGTSKAAWISQTLMRDIPARYPRVKLVNWFCRDKTSAGEANYRFDSSPGALAAFRVAVNSPLYRGRLNSN